MRKTISQLSDSDIADAHVVTLIAPNDSNYSQQLYGQETVSTLSAPNTSARRINYIEIEIDASDENQLQTMLDIVESIKGRLPRAAQRLRKPR